MSNRYVSRVWCLVLVLVTASAALGGCGQRGPLYLPEDAEEQEQQTR